MCKTITNVLLYDEIKPVNHTLKMELFCERLLKSHSIAYHTIVYHIISFLNIL